MTGRLGKNNMLTPMVNQDGALRSRSKKEEMGIFAIVEVKPFSRKTHRRGICMQESAQMAAWVSQQPPPATKWRRSWQFNKHRR